MVEKPEGATHLEQERPPDSEIEPEELVMSAARAASAKAAIEDPTDEILLSPNRTPGWPAGAPAGVTIHTEEGFHDPSVGWLRNPRSQASAHFCVRRDGHIVQLVWERDRAWHARSSGMFYFGIEHEGSGYPNDRAKNPAGVPCFWTTPKDANRLSDDDKMLKSSARLTAYLCSKHRLEVQHDFGEPPVRHTKSVIAGHDQMMNNDHIDPGPQFPWKAYMAEVQAIIAGSGKGDDMPVAPPAGAMPRWEFCKMVKNPDVPLPSKTDISFEGKVFATFTRSTGEFGTADITIDEFCSMEPADFTAARDLMVDGQKVGRLDPSAVTPTPDGPDVETLRRRVEAMQVTGLNGLNPWPEKVMRFLIDEFGSFPWWDGWRDPTDTTEHHTRFAVDIGLNGDRRIPMLDKDLRRGEQIVAALLEHRVELELIGIIWQQRQIGYSAWNAAGWSRWTPQQWPAPPGWQARGLDPFHWRHIHVRMGG